MFTANSQFGAAVQKLRLTCPTAGGSIGTNSGASAAVAPAQIRVRCGKNGRQGRNAPASRKRRKFLALSIKKQTPKVPSVEHQVPNAESPWR
jgi:hypothetical protein